jgi:2-polyprenyl-3-methyl-5-hydroxy-6-metoxy-1,4-benzoquinol methylase
MKDGKLWLYVMNRAWRYGPQCARQIVKILKKSGVRQGKFLEIACGNGRICTNMAKRGFDVTGIDISPLYIKDAVKRARVRGVKARYVCGDIRRLTKHVKGKFDVVLSIYTSIGYHDRRTDERIFRQAAGLLKKKGLFLILNTMSREWLINHYCTQLYEDAGRYIILHKGNFDRYHSHNSEKWIFFKKAGKDLQYVDELPLRLRIYGVHELVDMAEKAGLKFITAYDLLGTLQPPRADSSAHLVFQKP